MEKTRNIMGKDLDVVMLTVQSREQFGHSQLSMRAIWHWFLDHTMFLFHGLRVELREQFKWR